MGELRHHAVSFQQAWPERSVPDGPGIPAPWSTVPCSTSSARFIRIWQRATYPSLGFPLYAGEVGASEADDAAKHAAAKSAEAALAEQLEVFHKFYMDGQTFIGGDKPSIADIRLAATLEFLAVIDYPSPAWDLRTSWALWKRPSATPMPSRQATSVATSSM